MNLNRPILISVCADGAFTYRAKNEPQSDWSQPVASVNTKEDAELLRDSYCRPDSYLPNRYVLNMDEFIANDFDSLRAVGEKFERIISDSFQYTIPWRERLRKPNEADSQAYRAVYDRIEAEAEDIEGAINVARELTCAAEAAIGRLVQNRHQGTEGDDQ